MMEQSRITTLERRLALVENKIGLHKMSLLPHADLFEAVNEMQQRIKLLDNQKIESLQKRVQVWRNGITEPGSPQPQLQGDPRACRGRWR